MWNSFVFICAGSQNYEKKLAINMQTWAIERCKSSFSPPWPWPTYIFDFTCFKIYEIRSFYVAEQQKLWRNHHHTFKHLPSNAVSPIFLSVTLTYIFDFKCLQYLKFVRLCMCSDSSNYGKICNQTFAIERRKFRFYPPQPWPTLSTWNV